jgi:hypothetical protein
MKERTKMQADNELLPDLTKDSFGRKRGTAREAALQEGRIVRENDLLAQMQAYCDSVKIPDKEHKKAVKGDYRTIDKLQTFPLQDVSGNVTKEIWGKMLIAATKGMKKTIMNSQGNGDWKALDAQCAISVDQADRPVLMMGVRWVDMLNQPNLQYRNGQPAADVTVNNSMAIPEEVLAALKDSGGGRNETLEALLAQLIGVMTAQQESKGSTEAPASKGDSPFDHQ